MLLACLMFPPWGKMIHHFLNIIWQRQMFWTCLKRIVCLSFRHSTKGKPEEFFWVLAQRQRQDVGNLVILFFPTFQTWPFDDPLPKNFVRRTDPPLWKNWSCRACGAQCFSFTGDRHVYHTKIEKTEHEPEVDK